MRKPRRQALAIMVLAWSLVIPASVATSASAAGARPAPAASPSSASETLVPTPPMGFNNWNAFGCDVSEALIKETADVIVSSGLAEAGYEYVNIDDCWSLKERDADGRLVPDPVKFPSGISGVADYVHSKGLKLGIYGDAGTKTCAGYPGSLGTEMLDAQTWADWGVDYLKYDNCNNQGDGSREDFVRRYTAMREALDATGRPIVYSICEWGQSRPWEWAAGVGDLWRTTGDISDNWSSLRSIIAHNVTLAEYAGPGRWNDPDMMEIGNGGMSDIEYRTHMSMWAMMAAPLITGTDLRTASTETLAILGHRDIIAIDQDPLGVQAPVVSDEAGLMVLDKPLADGDRAIALYNSTDSLATISVPAGDTGLAASDAYRLQDVWTGGVTQTGSTISATVPAHGTVVYRVRPLAEPAQVAPSVTVGATLGTLIPGTSDGGTLTTTVTNRGVGTVGDVTVSTQAPEGWAVTASGGDEPPDLATDASVETTWAVRVPEGTAAGRYPITVTAGYTWGPDATAATSSSQVVTVVVNAPQDGRRHLSTVLAVSSANARGPVEADQSNGGQSPGDGALITIGGEVYTRGLGTTAPSEIRYYLGGRCSRLVTDVGIDDAAPTTVPATFTVYADDIAAATSGPVASGDAPTRLTADLTGATWLRLVTTGSQAAPDGTTINNQANWAEPVLTCGEVDADAPVLPAELTLFSFEEGTENFTIANVDSGGAVERTAEFHTNGDYGLAVSTPVDGNWFGRSFAEPLDLTGKSILKFDVRAGDTGTTGEIAVQVGPATAWCQGGRWAWTNANSSRTVTAGLDELSCPADVTLDPAQINAVWIFLNGGGVVHVDNIRAE